MPVSIEHRQRMLAHLESQQAALLRQPVASVESPMRMRHRGSFFPRRHIEPLEDLPARIEPVATIETPITSDFTPGQTIALLTMRQSELSRVVLVKLIDGTARATLEDYQDLMTLGYARRKANGYHELSPRGHFITNGLARALAAQLGIPTVTLKINPRTAFRPGVMSQNGNW